MQSLRFLISTTSELPSVTANFPKMNRTSLGSVVRVNGNMIQMPPAVVLLHHVTNIISMDDLLVKRDQENIGQAESLSLNSEYLEGVVDWLP